MTNTALTVVSLPSANLRDFFTRDHRHKVIIEGGFQDDWRNITLDANEFTIPQDTLRVHPGIDYDLDLVSRLNEKGVMEAVNVTPEEALELDYNFFQGIQRPRGMLVEDGRLFYDKSLLMDQPDLAKAFLIYLSEQWGAGKSFHQIHSEILKRRR